MESLGHCPRGKPAAAELRYPTLINSSPSVRSIFVWPYHQAVRSTLSFTTDGYGIFIMPTKLVHAAHTKGGVRHKQICQVVDSDGYENCPSSLPQQGT